MGDFKPQFQELQVETAHGRATYYGDLSPQGVREGRGVLVWPDFSYFFGSFKQNEIEGEGQLFSASSGTRFAGKFEKGRPVGKGILYQFLDSGAAVEYNAEFENAKSLFDLEPVVKSRRSRPLFKESMLTVCGMLAGPEQGPWNYDHCISTRGQLVWAHPPRGECPLLNSQQVKNKIVVMARGAVSFATKVERAQEAGAVGLVCVGADPNEEKYKPPIMRITTGKVGGEGTESGDLLVKIPTVYVLHRLYPRLQEGATAFIHFDAKLQGGWKAGSLYVQGEEEKTRNPEGEAKAQWNEADLTFDKEKTMIASDGRVVGLKDEKGAPPRQMKCEATNTSTKSRRDCKVAFLSSDVVLYKFKLSFGEIEWETEKRYSEFDEVDKKLNSLYGLPPVGLPPKQWFGLNDPLLISERQKRLTIYVQDCIKRPVLLLSQELQSFLQMPQNVIAALKRGG